MTDNKGQPAAIATIQELKGPPLTVLMAMFIGQAPVTQSFLAEVLDYSDKTVRSALRFLAEHGYVERVHYRQWRLAAGGFPIYQKPGRPTITN